MKRFTNINKFLKDENGGWEIIYTGFILILLCFFIMLCTFSTIEEDKITRFVQSFVNTLCILEGGVKSEKSKIIIPPSVDIVNIDSDLGKILHNLKTYTRDLGFERDVSFSTEEKGLVMRLSDNVLFNLGKADLSSGGSSILEKVAVVLKKTSHTIHVEGHTDNLPIHTDMFPSNWELSTARAVNVLRFFLEIGALASERLSAVGYGEFRPVSPNNTPENRAINRRVELVLNIPKNQ